jgi:hypothetical protein
MDKLTLQEWGSKIGTTVIYKETEVQLLGVKNFGNKPDSPTSLGIKYKGDALWVYDYEVQLPETV